MLDRKFLLHFRLYVANECFMFTNFRYSDFSKHLYVNIWRGLRQNGKPRFTIIPHIRLLCRKIKNKSTNKSWQRHYVIYIGQPYLYKKAESIDRVGKLCSLRVDFGNEEAIKAK